MGPPPTSASTRGRRLDVPPWGRRGSWDLWAVGGLTRISHLAHHVIFVFTHPQSDWGSIQSKEELGGQRGAEIHTACFLFFLSLATTRYERCRFSFC